MAFVSTDFMFQSTHQDNHSSPTSPHLLPSYAHQDFHGVSAAEMRRYLSFSGVGSKCEEMNADDDMSDDGSQLGEKKKRLSSDQVKALEKSFDLGNKLEPERKMQLARALGLQPRQVAIWFQNRRARWKTKQLEKDYDLLKRNFEALKSDNDALQAQNKKLQAELMGLKGRKSSTGIGPINLNKETEGSWSNGSENSCDVHLGTTRTPATLSEAPFYSHLLQSSSSRSDLPSHQKIDQMVPDEGFCNMFMGGTMADQSGFWPWPEQQHLH